MRDNHLQQINAIVAANSGWRFGAKLAAGLLLVGAVLISGYCARSSWIILLWGLGFTACYIVGRWRQWRSVLRLEAGKTVMRHFPITVMIQTVLVTLLYLLGRGVGAVAGVVQNDAVLNAFDYQLVALVIAVALAIGVVLVLFEPDGALVPQPEHDDAKPNDQAEIQVLTSPVTADQLFRGIHYTHGRYVGDERTFDGSANENSAGGDDKITAAEQRLGMLLPEGLKRVYRVQNGGSVERVCVPKPNLANHALYDDLIFPFSGYEDLLPLEALRTVHEFACDYADPDNPDHAGDFPAGSKQMLVLARWHTQTLFLDYTEGPNPRVGFATFEDADWMRTGHWWPSFDSFFSALRRYQTL